MESNAQWACNIAVVHGFQWLIRWDPQAEVTHTIQPKVKTSMCSFIRIYGQLDFLPFFLSISVVGVLLPVNAGKQKLFIPNRCLCYNNSVSKRYLMKMNNVFESEME